MEKLSEAVTDLTLLDERGRSVVLGTVKPAILVFMRHFGCIFCREQAAEFAARLPEIEAKGSRLVFISTGATYFAQAFREDYLARFPSIQILCDPERKSYRALGFRRGFLTMFRFVTWRRAWRAFRAGFRQSWQVKGDALQNGGVLVVDGSGVVRYRYASSDSGDHPDPAAAIGSLGVEMVLY